MRSLSSGASAQGSIENLSLGGCLLQLDHHHGFHRGENVEMTFCVRQLPVRVQASVRQLDRSDLVGVVFTLLSDRGRRQLLALIEELAEILHDQVDALKQWQKPSLRPHMVRGPANKDPGSRKR